MTRRSVLRSLVSKRLVASTMLVATLGATAVLAAAPLTGRSEQPSDPVIARVNDIEIRESDLRAVDKELGRNLPRGEGRRDAAIKFLTDTILVSAAAGETKLDEAEIRARTTFSRNRVITEQVLEAVARKATSDEAVRKAYDEMVANTSKEPEYHLFELYFPVVDRNDETAAKAAEEKARTARERIAKGDTFEAVVRDMSDNPTAKANGGNRGYVTLAAMGKEFADVAATLEKGKTSQPIKTQAGWHLIKVEQTRVRTPPDLASIRSDFELRLAGRAQLEFVSKLQSAAKIQRLDNVSAGSGETPPAK